MFNTTNLTANPVTNNTINAVSGIITKTFRKSYFIRFEKGSELEETIFNNKGLQAQIKKYKSEYVPYKEDSYEYRRGNYGETKYLDKNVVVLQVMLLADNNYLCEIIDQDDYSELFNDGLCREGEIACQ